MKRLRIAIIAAALLAACSPATPLPYPTPGATFTATSSQPTASPALTTPTSTPVPVPDILYVDPAKDLGPISPYVYGSNYGPWTAVPADLYQTALDSHITVLRFPGGRWGNENDIQTYQLDMFMDFCRKMGAIATIHVRFQGGTPEKAAEWVRYANIEKGYGIVYWSIGNEPDYELENGKKIDPKDFNPRWRAMALAMKAVDPTIKIMGPELSQWGVIVGNVMHGQIPKYPPRETPAFTRQDWMTEFLKANGDLVDIVTVHRYPMYSPSSTFKITPPRLRENAVEWNQYVVYLRSVIHEITGRDIPVAFTEINSDPSAVVSGVASPDSFYNAIWYADILGRLIQERVFMVNQFVLGGNSGGLPMLYPGQIRPIYYVFQMYYRFGNEQVLATSGKQYVDIFAARRPDGTLTLMVINMLDTEQTIPLKVEGVNLSSADVWLFDATHNAVDLGQQAFPADGNVVLPAQSITLYALGK